MSIKTSEIRFSDSFQCAYQPCLLSLHAPYVQEAISCNMRQKSEVYVCLLDTSTAFYFVWRPSLFHKLYHELGVKGITWKILHEANYGMESSVRLDDLSSKWFTIKQSV